MIPFLFICTILLPLVVIGLSASIDTSNGLGAARASLFQDYAVAMQQRTAVEATLLDPRLEVIQEVSKKKYYKKKKKSSTAGVGFGAKSSSTTSAPKVKLSKDVLRFAGALDEEGVVLIPGVLQKQTADDLRRCIYAEIEVMADRSRLDPLKSLGYFNVPAEIYFSTVRNYNLLPFRDEISAQEPSYRAGPIVDAAREMLTPGAPLAELFRYMLDGGESQLYDFNVLRTEPGAARQPVHYDTPFQEIAPLYCAFIALQDVTPEMGGTLFIPRTHTNTEERKRFDDGAQDGRRDEMLASCEPQYSKLMIGDAAVFDMRILHCGLPNLAEIEGGASRLLFALTFRNLHAKEELGHKPCLRPEYVGIHTLDSFQEELRSSTPFLNTVAVN
mmetsp:Transcript_20460/g.23477  ORF Transcript_20460/g.23477 Transcript_20460/m.23477 type:complete len:387 (-) Transcript_20460:222-1382(-)